MRPWVVWSLVSLVGWGVWGLMVARASERGPSGGVLAAVVLLEAVIVLPLAGQAPRALSWWIVGAALASAVAYWGLFRAIQTGGPGAAVVTLTSLYPAVTALLAALVVAEPMTIRKLLGIGLAIGAVVVLSHE